MDFNPVLITYTVPDPARSERLYKSAAQFEWEVKAIIQEGFVSWVHKFIAPIQLIKALRGSKYTHAIFVDAFDVIVVRDKASCLASFKRLGEQPLIFAAETNVYPDKSLESLYPKIDSIFKYVNAQYCIQINWDGLEEFEKVLADSDQDHMAKFYLKNLKNPNVVLDTNCEIFQCLYGVNAGIFDEHYKNTLTNSYPIFFHGNGKSNLDWIKT